MVAGYGLAKVIISSLHFSTLQGMIVGVCTLSAQAFGRKDVKLCSQVFTTALIVAHAIYIPTGVAIFFTEQLLLLAHIDPASSAVAGTFARWSTLCNIIQIIGGCQYAQLVSIRQ